MLKFVKEVWQETVEEATPQQKAVLDIYKKAFCVAIVFSVVIWYLGAWAFGFIPSVIINTIGPLWFAAASTPLIAGVWASFSSDWRLVGRDE